MIPRIDLKCVKNKALFLDGFGKDAILCKDCQCIDLARKLAEVWDLMEVARECFQIEENEEMADFCTRVIEMIASDRDDCMSDKELKED